MNMAWISAKYSFFLKVLYIYKLIFNCPPIPIHIYILLFHSNKYFFNCIFSSIFFYRKGYMVRVNEYIDSFEAQTDKLASTLTDIRSKLPENETSDITQKEIKERLLLLKVIYFFSLIYCDVKYL